MDTDEGYCWRCNSELRRGRIIKCGSCSMAEYCSPRCESDDDNRHKSVECATWSPRKCANYGKGGKNECTACLSVWYCGAECQKEDWEYHKSTCKMWRKRAKRAREVPFTQVQELPYYFGNIIANDILKLESNEMREEETIPELSILLAACGDLRHVIQTIHSLPAKFEGNLRFVLNDIDPFVGARNILLLFMVATFEHDKTRVIANIWLSLRLSKTDFSALQDALSFLGASDPESIKKRTNGIVDVDEKSCHHFKKVWSQWRKMECLIGKGDCVPLDQERQEAFRGDPDSHEGFTVLLRQIPSQFIKSIEKWRRDGVIICTDDRRVKLPYYNPTFTGRSEIVPQLSYHLDPSNHKFHYCVKSDCAPFAMWDYLRMKIECSASDINSITAMCHAFTTACVASAMTIMAAKRISVEVFSENYTNLKSKLPDSYRGRFDRIYVSNMMDFHPLSKILSFLEPFLSNVNPCAVILTDTLNWTFYDRDSEIPFESGMCDDKLYKHLILEYKDNPMRVLEFGKSFYREYYDNTTFFVAYLRGRHMADGLGNLPKWSELVRCESLTLRDFRKTRNRVWPFRQRVSIRATNMLTGRERTLEWYRNESS